MPVDETGSKIPTAQVQNLLSMMIITDAGNPVSANSNIASLNLTGKDVYNSGISQKEVGGKLTSGYRD
jgi:hypothetical protein